MVRQPWGTRGTARCARAWALAGLTQASAAWARGTWPSLIGSAVGAAAVASGCASGRRSWGCAARAPPAGCERWAGRQEARGGRRQQGQQGLGHLLREGALACLNLCLSCWYVTPRVTPLLKRTHESGYHPVGVHRCFPCDGGGMATNILTREPMNVN